MARPKKKNSNPQQSMEVLLANTVALYGIPYDVQIAIGNGQQGHNFRPD